MGRVRTIVSYMNLPPLELLDAECERARLIELQARKAGRKLATLLIERSVWEEFRNKCWRQGTTASKVLRDMISLYIEAE